MQSQTFNIALPRELVKKIDKFAKREYKNRSELIRTAVWGYIKELEDWEEIFARGKEVGRKMGIKSEEDVNRIVYEFRHGRKSR